MKIGVLLFEVKAAMANQMRRVELLPRLRLYVRALPFSRNHSIFNILLSRPKPVSTPVNAQFDPSDH